MDNETMIAAEELFGEVENQDRTPARKGRARGRKSQGDLFAELKIKMVMRIYGVSKKDALGIIAGREAERQALERAKEQHAKRAKDSDDELMTAEELFGAI